jgi:hypothetical protein
MPQHGTIISNLIPLVYWSLSTRRACYPKYIMLKNGLMPVRINHHYYVVARNLLCVCINDDDHIQPYEAHFQLAIFATLILFQTYFSQDEITSLA